MRAVVLLGAGASADADIPTTLEMTNKVIESIREPRQRRLLEFIRLTLGAYLAQQDPLEGATFGEAVSFATDVDVERLFASVDLLVSRNEQAWRPFVAAWHPGLDAFTPPQRVRRQQLNLNLHSVAQALSSAIESASRHNTSPMRIQTQGIQRALGDLIQQAFENALPPDVTSLLREARTEMLRSLFNLLAITDASHVAYLQPLVALATEQAQLTIGTLNYDRAIENVGDLAGIACDTGINDAWQGDQRLTWKADAPIRLMKLHGSIDWVTEGRHANSGELPLTRIRKVTPDEKSRYESPAVVFGEAGKLRSDGPFLELLLEWATALREANRLLIIGYSFRDDHINEVIARWFVSDEDRRIVVLSPSRPAGKRSSFANAVAQAMEPIRAQRGQPEREPRIAHVAGRTADVLESAIEAVKS